MFFMQPITILGLALCLGVLFLRAREARNKPASSPKQRFKTAHLLIGVLIVWLVISFNLQHLDKSISGEPQTQSTWEKVVRTISDWI
jgi:capsular polysaccharide biosynthesis protein